MQKRNSYCKSTASQEELQLNTDLDLTPKNGNKKKKLILDAEDLSDENALKLATQQS